MNFNLKAQKYIFDRLTPTNFQTFSSLLIPEKRLQFFKKYREVRRFKIGWGLLGQIVF